MITSGGAKDLVAQLIQAAGGEIVGRTKLQKIIYLLNLSGSFPGLSFEYRHYGPYSDDLTDALRSAKAFGLISEDEKVAGWGGRYSIFRSLSGQSLPSPNRFELEPLSSFVRKAASIGSIELELAATAAFLKAAEGIENPWVETAKRKPEKASPERLAAAQSAYSELLALAPAGSLPDL